MLYVRRKTKEGKTRWIEENSIINLSLSLFFSISSYQTFLFFSILFHSMYIYPSFVYKAREYYLSKSIKKYLVKIQKAQREQERGREKKGEIEGARERGGGEEEIYSIRIIYVYVYV